VAIKNRGKTEALLTCLALAPLQGVIREVLLAAVWPDSEFTLAGHALNSMVHRMRLLVGDALGGATPVVQSDGHYRLNQEAGVRVDVSLFKALVAQGDREARVDPSAAMPSYAQALRLYRGDLVASGYEPAHTFLERDGLRATYLALLMRLSDYYFNLGNFGTCLAYALQLLGHDPCREDAHRLARYRGKNVTEIRVFW